MKVPDERDERIRELEDENEQLRSDNTNFKADLAMNHQPSGLSQRDRANIESLHEKIDLLKSLTQE